MSTKALSQSSSLPALFNNFFKPWNEWFEGYNRQINIPAVNIAEEKDRFLISLAAPGLKKEDFKIDVNGQLLTISSEKESEQENKDASYTRREYSYSSFSRSFTLPDEVNQDQIEARYENGILQLILPLKADTKKNEAKQISVH
jgi:HSP20 family protein